MTGIRRFKIVIISALVLAAILFVACFSVSYAQWSGGDASAEVSGNIGQFYVEYPAASTSGETPDESTYYAVMQNGSTAYYYPMTKGYNNGNIQYALNGLRLAAGENIAFYKGSTKIVETIGDDNSGWCGTITDGVFTAKCDALYNFYLKLNNTTGAHTNLTLYADNTYYNRLEIEYRGGTLRLALSEWTLNAYVWRGSSHFDGSGFSAIDNWPGVVVQGAGNSSSESNITYFDFSGVAEDTATAKLSVIFNMKADTTTYQTGTIVFSEFAANYADGELHYIELVKGTTTAPGSTTNKLLTLKESIHLQPPCITVTVSGGDGSEDMEVRSFIGATTAENGYAYSNNVCISRRNGDGASDNSIAFVIFSVEAEDGTDLSAVDVESITLTRKKTNADGSLAGGDADFSPRLYGLEGVRKLSDINHVVQNGSTSNNQVAEYYENGVYCILFFADGGEQYFAMELTIKTVQPAKFRLTATASNTNHWQRYEPGYGEPWGYYLGGRINNVELWDPRRTTKMQVNNDTSTVDPDDESTYSEAVFDKDKVKYPKGYVDISLTVNLTEGSIVKQMMIGSTGKREGSKTIWITPTEIQRFPQDLFDAGNIYDKELNLIIPKTGEYTFRYVGHIVKPEDATTGRYINLKTGAIEKTPVEGSNAWLANYNLIIDKLYISLDTAESKVNVTFDPNGGTLANESDAVQTSGFGRTLKRPADPIPPESFMTFDGWYIDAECTTAYDFDMPIESTEDFTLYAKYDTAGYHAVKYDYNYDNAPSGATEYIADGGKATRPVDPTRPDEYWSWDGGGMAVFYVFGGWYTDAECTEFWNYETDTVSQAMTLYAKWHFKHELADNWYVVSNGSLVKMTYSGVPEDTLYKDEYKINVELKKGMELRFFADGSVPSYVCENSDVIQKNNGESFAIALVDGLYTLYFKATEDRSQAVLTAVPFTTAVTVTFDLDGGSMSNGEESSQIISSGEKAVKPSDPTHGASFGNYTVFLGWYADAEKTTPFDFDSAISANTTVYAKWANEANGWSVRRNDEPDLVHLDNVADDADVKAIVGEHGVVGGATMTLAAGDRIYLYAGNATCQLLTVTANSGAGVVGEAANAEFVTVSTAGEYMLLFAGSDLYIAAQVTFDANSGTLTDSALRIVAVNGTVAQPADPTRAGYAFDGWYVNGATSAFDFTEPIVCNTVLTATWVRTYTVTFDLNGAIGSVESQTIRVGGNAVKPDVDPTRSGYTFNGWYSDKNGAKVYDFDSPVGADITLYAKWYHSTVQNDTFYVMGSINSWTTTAKFELVPHESDYHTEEYAIFGLTLSVGDEFKIAKKVASGLDWYWIKNSSATIISGNESAAGDANFKVKVAGTYNIFVYPNNGTWEIFMEAV